MEAVTDLPIPAESLYRGLKAIWETEFPKTCPKCARVFETFEEYLIDTQPLPQCSGLMGYDLGDEGQQVGLFRNCLCGTTILAFCHDRRDLSEAGNRRRALFGELLDRLVDTGLSAQVARLQLLKALRTTPNLNDLRVAS